MQHLMKLRKRIASCIEEIATFREVETLRLTQQVETLKTKANTAANLLSTMKKVVTPKAAQQPNTSETLIHNASFRKSMDTMVVNTINNAQPDFMAYFQTIPSNQLEKQGKNTSL